MSRENVVIDSEIDFLSAERYLFPPEETIPVETEGPSLSFVTKNCISISNCDSVAWCNSQNCGTTRCGPVGNSYSLCGC